MTPGKAGGLLGERLKGANNTVSRLKAADFFSFPLEGGRGGNRKRSGGPFPRRAGARAVFAPPAGRGGRAAGLRSPPPPPSGCASFSRTPGRNGDGGET